MLPLQRANHAEEHGLNWLRVVAIALRSWRRGRTRRHARSGHETCTRQTTWRARASLCHTLARRLTPVSQRIALGWCGSLLLAARRAAL